MPRYPLAAVRLDMGGGRYVVEHTGREGTGVRLNLPSYPSIFNLGRRAIAEFYKEEMAKTAFQEQEEGAA